MNNVVAGGPQVATRPMLCMSQPSPPPLRGGHAAASRRRTRRSPQNARQPRGAAWHAAAVESACYCLPSVGDGDASTWCASIGLRHVNNNNDKADGRCRTHSTESQAQLGAESLATCHIMPAQKQLLSNCRTRGQRSRQGKSGNKSSRQRTCM